MLALLLAFGIMFFYPLAGKKLEELRAKIAELDANLR
jgi:Na+/melibiose symporter-like transporter